MGERSRKQFYRIMNRPNRYLSRDSLDAAQVSFDVWQDYYEEQDWMCRRIEQFEHDLYVMKQLSPAAAIDYLQKSVGYEEYLKEYAAFRGIEREDLFEIVEQLIQSAKEYSTHEQWLLHIEKFKEELQQKESHRSLEQKKEGITLSTIHAAKGLEYEVVFLPDLNEGVLPYKKAVLPEDIEEERRLLYVGMTRAKHRLYLSSVRKILHKEAEISSFLKEIGF
jgi:DNA helicase-2/ATP-dependent DNA helicase PcrA